MTKIRNNVIILQAIKNYTILKWGLGRSPKRGEGGSPTFSPFPGERGLGIGIENKHFFEKTDFFYKLNVIICLLLRQKHRVFKNYIIHHPDASVMP